MSDLKKLEISPSVSILVAGVLIAAAILYTNTHPGAALADAQGASPTLNANVPAPSAQDHIIGSLDAPVVLIEYSDFQCPYCSLVYPTLKRIVSESNGKVAWVMRNFPLKSIHPNANPAANAAECIAEQLGSAGWWKFADAVFTDQSQLSDSYYESLAVSFGADRAKYESCYASSKYQSKIDAQANEAMQNGGQGTPYTIVYGGGAQKGVSGAVPYEQFMAVINAVTSRQ